LATQTTPEVTSDPTPLIGDVFEPNVPVLAPEPILPEPVVIAPSSENDIERGADGLYSLKVGNKVYKAKTIRSLLNETAKAIANGDTRIKELNTELKIKRGTIVPDLASDLDLPTIAPIGTDEAFQLGQDLLRPESMSKAVRRLVESEPGISLDSIKSDREVTKSAQFRERALAAGKEFLQAHPEFVPSNANESKMFDFMQERNIPPISLKNYEIAFSLIKDTLDLREEEDEPVVVPTPTPVVPTPTPTPNAPAAPQGTLRRRQATTGVAPGASSVPANSSTTLPGIPGFPTRDQIERMSAVQMANHEAKYGQKWIDHMELLYAPKRK
jgi:hypothetical protein